MYHSNIYLGSLVADRKNVIVNESDMEDGGTPEKA